MKKTLLVIAVMLLSASASFAADVRIEKNTYFIDNATGSAVIKNGNTQQARQEAKQAAYRDAIDKAMELFAGQMNADFKNKVFAKSQSIVKNFKIDSENINGDTLSVTGSCSVGEKAFDGILGPEVISMLGNPRVMIIVDEEDKSEKKSEKIAPVIENELLGLFEKAGYLIVDREQAQTLLTLDPKKAFNNPELAAKTVKADVLVVAHAEAGAAHTQRFGIHMYKPSSSVSLKAVLTKTAYQISSSTISKSSGKWQGSSSAAGMIRSSVKQAAEEIIYKIAYRMASAGSALGGFTVNIKLAGASFKDVEDFTKFLKESGQVFERSYSREMTEIDLVSPKNARNVASLISDFSLPGGNVEVDGLTAQTVSAFIRPAVQQKKEEQAKPDVKLVVVNIFLDKLGEDEAHKIEYELRKFVGSESQLQGDYQNKQLKISVKIAGTIGVSDIEKFLRDDMKNKGIELLIDKPDGDSIKGSKPGMSWWW